MKKLTTKLTAKLIEAAQPVTLHNQFYDETFTRTVIKQDRKHIYTDDGGIFEKADLFLVADSAN